MAFNTYTLQIWTIWQKKGTLFSRAFCAVAWCAPSRNSFLTGRRPEQTQAYGFISSFRDAPGGKNWVSMPQYFKNHGYYSTSLGKTFHPQLPAKFDYPYSWTDEPWFVDKAWCVNGHMTCEVDENTADRQMTSATLTRLEKFSNSTIENFFMAVGFQSPRLPWLYPKSAAKWYPNASDIPIATHQKSLKGWGDLEWYRPSEIDVFSNINNSHDIPISPEKQHQLRQAYYSTASHVDELIGVIMKKLGDLNLLENTNIILTADHGQNLGEHNMWSMMNLLEPSLQVPLIIKPTFQPRKVYDRPVELVDLYPTLASLAGLPLPSGLPGSDLSTVMHSNVSLNKAALGQITRCYNCTEAYDFVIPIGKIGCVKNLVDAKKYTVPCFATDPKDYDYMGMSVRTEEWRYSLFCRWDGEKLKPNWLECQQAELHDLRNCTAFFDEDSLENENYSGSSEFRNIEKELDDLLRRSFYQ